MGDVWITPVAEGRPSVCHEQDRQLRHDAHQPTQDSRALDGDAKDVNEPRPSAAREHDLRGRASLNRTASRT
jgi:hypothetical protein